MVCSQVPKKCNSVAVNENHSERTRQNVFAILRSIQYPLGRQDIVLLNGDSTQDITESLFGSPFAFTGLWISQNAPEIHAQILN